MGKIRDFGIRPGPDSWFHPTNSVTLGKVLSHSKLQFLHLLEQKFHLPHRIVRIKWGKGKCLVHSKYSNIKVIF